MDRRTCLVAAAVLAMGSSAFAQAPRNRAGAVAIKGYDPVAYFTEARARKGADAIAQEFDGRQYHFATARHRELFVADPIRYLPQYGGQCASSMAAGVNYEADPERWVIIDGKLYLFGNAQGRDKFRQDAAALARAGDQNWNSGVARR